MSAAVKGSHKTVGRVVMSPARREVLERILAASKPVELKPVHCS